MVLTPSRLPAGPAHADEAQHHVGEVGSEVRRPASLRTRRLPKHRPDRPAHAAGRLPAARQRAHARRPAAVRPQLGAGGRSAAAAQPQEPGLEPEPARPPP